MSNLLKILFVPAYFVVFSSCKTVKSDVSKSKVVPIPLAGSERHPDALPSEYDSMTACDKQAVLMKRIRDFEYNEENPMPDLVKVSVFDFHKRLSKKMKLQTDQAPAGWKKAIHRYSSVAGIKFESTGSHPYTGLFQGADCGIIRMSMLEETSDSVNPGLAIKLLAKDMPSANVSALYSSAGQGDDYNIFAHQLSTAIGKPTNAKGWVSEKLFGVVSKYPRRLSLKQFSTYTQDGQSVVKDAMWPFQLFFKPKLQLSSDQHDFRDGLAGIPENTPLYDVYALSKETIKNINKKQLDDMQNDELWELANSKDNLIGTIITTSRFYASIYGDLYLFFRHQNFDDESQ